MNTTFTCSISKKELGLRNDGSMVHQKEYQDSQPPQIPEPQCGTQAENLKTSFKETLWMSTNIHILSAMTRTKSKLEAFLLFSVDLVRLLHFDGNFGKNRTPIVTESKFLTSTGKRL